MSFPEALLTDTVKSVKRGYVFFYYHKIQREEPNNLLFFFPLYFFSLPFLFFFLSPPILTRTRAAVRTPSTMDSSRTKNRDSSYFRMDGVAYYKLSQNPSNYEKMSGGEPGSPSYMCPRHRDNYFCSSCLELRKLWADQKKCNDPAEAAQRAAAKDIDRALAEERAEERRQAILWADSPEAFQFNKGVRAPTQ